MLLASKKGFALTHLLVGGAVSAFTILLLAKSLSHLHGQMIRSSTGIQDQGAFGLIQTYLMNGLGGTKNFQGLSFRYTNSNTTIQSLSAGFIVTPNTQWNGALFPREATVTSDLLTYMEKVPMPNELRLLQDLPPGANSVSLSDSNARSYFSNADYLIVSNTRVSEAVKVNNMNLSSTLISGGLKVNLAGIWYESLYRTGTTPRIINSYRKGDPVYKAKMVQLGYEPRSQCIILTENSAEKYRACGFQSFQVFYDWKSSVNCRSMVLQPPPVDYERDRWSQVNSGTQLAYRCIDSIKLVFTESGNGKRLRTVILKANQ